MLDIARGAIVGLDVLLLELGVEADTILDCEKL